MKESEDIKDIRLILENLKKDGKILLAYLYGSYASGKQHRRSDIDLALYLNAADEKETIITVRERSPDIREFLERAREVFQR